MFYNLVVIFLICIGGYVYTKHSDTIQTYVMNDLLGMHTASRASYPRHVSEDTHYYYLTSAEIRSMEPVIRDSIETRVFRNPTLPNGTVIRVIYKEYGPPSPTTGRPQKVALSLAKPLRLLNAEGTIAGKVIPWP